jgi:hypothetical protein
VCTVVYHSSFWAYLPESEQDVVRDALAARGAAATRDDPLAWLRAEESADGSKIELRLRTWPGATERLLGLGHPHGRSVRWRPEVVPLPSTRSQRSPV